MDGQPVVAIVGQQARSALGSQYQQEVDLPALFKDVASEFVQTITTATQARHVVDRAFRVALASRRPTCIVIPTDVQEADAKDPPRAHLTAHSSEHGTRRSRASGRCCSRRWWILRCR